VPTTSPTTPPLSLPSPLQACDEVSLEDFGDACADFDRITPLDPWKTSMLLKAKKFISDQVGGEDGELDFS
jgi:alpha-soluble NSF attachment protein